jgi:hypothetical protein
MNMSGRTKDQKHPVDVIAGVMEQADFPADDGKNKVRSGSGSAAARLARRRSAQTAKASIRTSSLTFSDTVFGLGGLETRGTTRCSADLPQPSAPLR